MKAAVLATGLAALYSLPNRLYLAGVSLVALLAYRTSYSRMRTLGPIELAALRAESGQLCTAAELLSGPAYSKGSKSVYAQAALAYLHLRRGQFGQAIFMLTRLAFADHPNGNSFRRSVEHSIAYVFAAAGALELAEQHWSGTNRLRDPISPVGCLLLCRRGRFSDLIALTTSAHGFPRTSASVAPTFDWHGERVVALLCAFAHAQDESQSATSKRRLHELLHMARPTYVGEYDYLQAAWPELRTFVEGQEGRLRATRSRRIPASAPKASALRHSNLLRHLVD